MKKTILLSNIIQIALMLLLCTSASCQNETANTKADDEIQSLLDKGVKIWNTGDLSIADEIYSPEILYHHLNIYEDRTGIDAFKEFVASIRTTYPDFFVVFENTFIEGEWATAQWTISGTNTGPRGDLPPTGKKMKVSGVTIYQIKDGKIVEEWLYYNQGAILKQLGYTFNPPSIEDND